MVAMEAPNTRSTKIRFGLFEFDSSTRELRKQGRRLKLQDLPLRLLTSLLQAPGELVPYEKLRGDLWGDTFVNFDDGLHTAVRKLREALGDSATNPRFVATVPRHGYRFIAPVSPPQEAEKPVPQPARHMSASYLLMGTLVALSVAVSLLALRTTSKSGDAKPLLQTVEPLTSFSGNQRSPSFSPDGRQVAFAWTGPAGDILHIYIQSLDGSSPRRLTNGPAPDDFPEWSPDGRRIAFIRSGMVYLAPVEGGQESALTEAAGSGLAWSRDGSLLAVSGRTSESALVGILLVSVATGQKRRLTTPSAFAVDEFPAFSWSGKELAFVRADTTVDDVYVVPVAGSSPARRVTDFGEPITDVTWTPDDRFVVFGARGLFRAPVRVSAPERPVRIATSDDSALDPVIWRSAQTGRSQLAFARAIRDTDILGMEIRGRGPAASPPVRVAVSTLADHGPTISPDGAKVAFSSGRTGIEQIWTVGADGSNPRQLTYFEKGLCATSPSFSPDGKSIAFDATEEGNRDIYVVRADGGGMVRLTRQQAANAQPSWSHDGKWIYFRSERSGSGQIWKARADGSEPIQLTKGGGYQAFESPDGKLVFYAKGRGLRGIWSVPVDGGPEVPVLQSAWHNAWAVAEGGIYYVDFDHAGTSDVPVNRFDFATGKTVNVTKLPAPVATGLPALAVRRDGRWLAWVAMVDHGSGLMLVRDFRW
jgi:Tol biopolymer transport system component/DNA-binding winged helix-turn-helix (wHTH) protein